MNTVDKAVKELILSWPTLYHNRFQALTRIFTNSANEWKDGELKSTYQELSTPGTVETFLKHFHDEVEKKEKEKRDTNYPTSFNDVWILEAKLDLARAEIVAKNIDLVSTNFWYGHGMYPATYFRGWMTYQVRGGMFTYWHINTRPSDVKREWQRAIVEWLQQFMSIMHGVWGSYSDGSGKKYNERPSGWYPSYPETDGRGKFYTHVQKLYRKWVWFNEEERIASEELTRRILEEIKQEEQDD
jgi:hypothetical protein